MWVLDHLEDVASDLSVFHRVDDWRELPSSRFFLLSERLPAYDGVVRAVLLAGQPSPPVAAPAPVAGVAGRPVLEDMSLMASIADHPGFPGIEYVGG